MKIQRFEEVESWREARKLTNELYGLLKDCPDRSFKDQLQRASVSIMNNIAEGFERNTDKELQQFLYIAKGSAGEVRSMIILGSDLRYFSKQNVTKLGESVQKISALLAGFIKKL